MLYGVVWSPLGEYEPFRSWNGSPRAWGPDDQSRVWFGGEVVDGLVSIIDEHLARDRPGRRFDTLPAAIGCVPWLTHRGVAERLAQLEACCIVVDKGHGRLAAPLAAADNGFPNVLPGLRERTPGGKAVMLGPSSSAWQVLHCWLNTRSPRVALPAWARACVAEIPTTIAAAAPAQLFITHLRTSQVGAAPCGAASDGRKRRALCSRSSRARLRRTPQRYPEIEPSFFTIR